MIIAYCDKCGMRVPEAELEAGTAVKLDEFKFYCAKCAPASSATTARKPPSKILSRQTVAAALSPVQAPPEQQPPAPARKSTGAIVLPARAPGPLASTAGGSARGAAATKAPSAPQAGNPLPWIVGAVGGVVFLIGVIVAFGGKKEDASDKHDTAEAIKQPTITVPAATPVTPSKIETPHPATVIAQNTPPAESANPASAAERAKAADKEMEQLRNERAARTLEESKAWFAAHPQDPWTYKERLDALVTTYRSSPAGVEAAKLLADLKMPEGEPPPDSVNWHRAWEVTPRGVQAMNDSMDGRRFVLATHPIEMGKPCILNRTWKVPEDRPILEFSGRAHDAGDFQLVVVVSGRTLLSEVVRGREWRTYDCDLTALKGKDAEISFQHHNTEWENEHAWWVAPRFVDRPSVGAHLVRWDSAIAQATLPPDDAWRNAVDMLSQVDVNKNVAVGSWTLKPGEGLISSMERPAKIELPGQPPEEYDFRIVFTRRNSPRNDCVAQVLSKNGHDFTYVMSCYQNKITGFELVGGKRCSENPMSVRNWGWLQNGRKYTSVVQVRNDGVRALLDGKLICQWATDFSDMSQHSEWNLRTSGILGLAAYDTECCFESVQVLDVTGKTKPGGGTPPATVAVAAVPAAPTAEARAWKPLFDGTNLDCLRGKGNGAWRVDNGALVSGPGQRSAAQTQFTFDDGFIRVRFEVQDCMAMQFTARQGEEGGFSAEFDRSRLPGMAGKQHELIFICQGENVSATLDGQAFPLTVRGHARKGTLQFHARDGVLRVQSIEFAEPGVAAPAPTATASATAPAGDTRTWKPLFDGKTLDCLQEKGNGAWRVDNGALVSEATKRGAAQTNFQFDSGFVRVRFDCQDNSFMQFTVRQGGGGGYAATLDRKNLVGMAGKAHELLFSCQGENVSITLDGLSFPVTDRGAARKGALQFYAADGALRVHSIEFAEPGAAPPASVPASPPGTAALPASATVAAAKTAPLDPAVEAKVEYEKMLADVYGLLLKNAVRPALARLEQAKADGKLATMRAAIEQDLLCAKYAEELGAAVAKGVQALADKRPFVFKKTDNKETAVGQGSKNSVVSMKDEQIEIEMDLGGGAKAGMKVPMEQLSAETRLGLAKIGIAVAPDAELKTAFANLLLLQGGVGEITPKMVRMHLDAAKKAGAAAEKVAHIAGRLEAREHEAAAEVALKKLDALQKDKKWPEAKAAIESLHKEFGDTLALAKQQAELDKEAAEIEFQLNPAKPGLWASYWSGDGTGDKFRTMHFARPETKLCFDWGEGSPDARVPKDNFAIKWAGKLRIERDGRYRLKGDADDRVWIWIDGVKVIDKNEQEVPLTRGDHDFKVVYEEDSGGAKVWITWKMEGGGFDWQEISPSLMSYDTRMIERYQKE